MYSSVNLSVKLDKGCTPFFTSQVGVKKGCNLSPTLFNMFINGIPDLFNSSCDPVQLGKTDLNCSLYADDLVLLSFTNQWKLKINLKKSKVLIFRATTKRQLHLSSNWYFEVHCYLGITFHFSGNFKKAQNMLYNKALCVYHCLFKRFSNVENVPIKVLVKLFSSMVIPVLLYGCEIWGPFLVGKITYFETFKTKIFKITNQVKAPFEIL